METILDRVINEIKLFKKNNKTDFIKDYAYYWYSPSENTVMIMANDERPKPFNPHTGLDDWILILKTLNGVL